MFGCCSLFAGVTGCKLIRLIECYLKQRQLEKIHLLVGGRRLGEKQLEK